MPRSALAEQYARLEVGAPADASQVWANWVVRLRARDTAIGVVQASAGIDGADLAWVIGKEWQGKGYASEAVRAMAKWLRDAGVSKLTAHIHPENAASAHVARRAGLGPTQEIDPEGELIWESLSA